MSDQQPPQHHDLGQPMFDALNNLTRMVRALDAFAGPAVAAPIDVCIRPLIDAYVAVSNELQQRVNLAQQQAAEFEAQVHALRYGLGVAVAADVNSPNCNYAASILDWYDQGALGDPPVRPGDVDVS